jgi:hypothetical protein
MLCLHRAGIQGGSGLRFQFEWEKAPVSLNSLVSCWPLLFEEKRSFKDMVGIRVPLSSQSQSYSSI